MHVFNIHEAKTQLSKLIELALSGQIVIVARAGEPVVQITAINPPEVQPIQRMGFLEGQITVPSLEEFNQIGADEIADMFGEE